MRLRNRIAALFALALLTAPALAERPQSYAPTRGNGGGKP